MLLLISLILSTLLHELAHLIAAKLLKCKVDVMSIGFGKPIFKKKIGETLYQIAPILLGGYCKLLGEESYSAKKTAFCNLSYRNKAFITMAGIIVNIISGLISLIIGSIYHNYGFIYFAWFSIIIGVGNAIPAAPCLDGGYLIYYPLFIKLFGKKKGLVLFTKISKLSFYILLAINIIFVFVWLWLYYVKNIRII